MIYFVDNNGTVIDALTTPVNQGSVDTNNIYLIAPFASNLQFAVAFQLPNGLYTERYVMTPVGEIPNVQYAPTNAPYSIWSFTMPNDITQYYGTVYAQFYAYGTNGQITATSRTSFVVAAGVPEQLPSTPTQDVYNQILTALSQYSSQLNSGAYAARSIYWWIDTYTYGMNEITFYPVGTYGAFVKSLVTNNTGNQPYNSDGVLSSEYWAELVNFNTIFNGINEVQSNVEAAQEAAQSAETSATTAEQSATKAAGSASSAAGSATEAGQSATAAASSAQSALTSANEAATSADTAQQAAQEVTDYLGKTAVFVDELPSTGDSQYLYFVAGADNNLFSIYTWDGAWQLLGSANLVVNNTKTYNLTLLSTAWSGNQQTLTVDGISDTDNVNAYPAEGYSDVYINEGIQAISAGSSGVTFSCTSVPSENISVIVSVDTEVAIPTADGYYTQSQSNTLFASTGTLTLDPSTFVITMTLKSISGATLVTQSIDLPVESMVVDATYDSGTKSIILTLQNGNTVSVPVGDLVDGLATTEQLNAEISAREAADATLQNNINTETSARANADTNLQNQIDDIVDGTTVVGAAESANLLTDGFNVGDTSNTVIVGYYKFATIEKLVNYQQANIRLEISDANIANYPQQICGIELRYYNSPTSPDRIDVAVLYGNPAILSYIYVSVSTEGDIDLYFYNSGAYGSITIKPLYQNSRTNQDKFNIFANITDYISTLPSAATNTALPDLEHYEIITEAKNLALPAAVGSSVKPVYFSADGVPVACGDELDVSVTGGASYLTKNGIVNASATTQVGWWKVFSVPMSKLQSISVASTYSVLVEVNGVYDGDEGSGKIEINGRSNSSLWAEANCRALSGNLNLQNFAVAVSSDGANLEFYTYAERQFTRIVFTVTSEYYSVSAVNVITWTLAFSSTTAPSGAVYAVNRNYAAQVENALTLVAGATTEVFDGSEAVTFNVTSQAGQAVYQSISIPTSAWSGNSATVTVSGATSSAYIEASAADTASAAQVVNNNIVATTPGTNTLTFTADSTPTATVNMNILIIY